MVRLLRKKSPEYDGHEAEATTAPYRISTRASEMSYRSLNLSRTSEALLQICITATPRDRGTHHKYTNEIWRFALLS